MPTSNDKSNNADKKKPKPIIIGIEIIGNIVASVSGISNPAKIYGAIKQIIYFFNLLPSEWKKRAYFAFEKLWLRKEVIITTNPDTASGFMEANFEDARINQLFQILPDNDKVILLAGKGNIDLNNKGLHTDSYNFKGGILYQHGYRGINIIDMLSTGDIDKPLVEMDGKKPEEKIHIFNWWADNYQKVALMLPDDPITDAYENVIKKGIEDRASSGLKSYVLVNYAGKLEDTKKLIDIITEMKTKKQLNYVSIIPQIKDIGFKSCVNICIDF